ncbi:MAG: sulfate adenylyltransferase [Patescibacteria group bacterium]
MIQKKIKIIVTLGPATRDEASLRNMKSRGVDFVRVNMSHSSLEDQGYFMRLARKVGIPFILDTEGSQIRNSAMKEGGVVIPEGSLVELYRERIVGDEKRITLTPASVVPKLEVGDIIYIDFNSLILRVLDTSPVEKNGYVISQAISGGRVGSNKAVIIDSGMQRRYDLPSLSPKDLEAIKIAKQEGIGHIAFSFARSGEDVRRAREVSGMNIIAKIECLDGLENLPDIIKEADALLIDRGDLSKEIPIEHVPLAQKAIIRLAEKAGKETYVATNLLESMVEKKEPTRAEVHDIISTILDGASGLALAAETAIGKYPIGSINTLNKIIRHTGEVMPSSPIHKDVADRLIETDYLARIHTGAALIEPHGGALVNRLHRGAIPRHVEQLPRISLTSEQYMDLEQIAIGTFSPIEGFMGSRDVESVLVDMRLAPKGGESKGVVWPIPIVLDVDKEKADSLSVGSDIALTNEKGNIVGLLHLSEKFSYDRNKFARELYGTDDKTHPGVRMVYAMKPVFLGGKVTLFERRQDPYKSYELTPRQTRRIFEENGWSRVVGFHTRNVPHRGHEFIQEEALRQSEADGLFVHPVIGKKKAGDFEPLPIIKAYEIMMEGVYPKGKTVFGTYATFSRYAGPREAIFTALCRKNFGCSHFVVGRDHTGVGDFYAPTASHEIFDKFSDLGIVPVRFGKVFYSNRLKKHMMGNAADTLDEALHVSGTEARKMFLKGVAPPEWFMRPEISNMILRLIKEGKEVFVNEG